MKSSFYLLFWSCLLISLGANAQDDLSKIFANNHANKHYPVIATFKGETLINAQTTETMHKHDLLFLVGHRFGDIGGTYGGGKTFFGFDAISDVLIGFDYGITDRLSVGLGRAKGAPNDINEFQSQLYYLSLKYKLFAQTEDNHVPLSVSLFGRGIVTSIKNSGITTSNTYFQNFADRLSGVGQLILARKISERLSLEVLPTFVRRNAISAGDMNNMFAVGVGGRFKITQHMGIVVDYFVPFRNTSTTDYYKQQYNLHFYNALGVGLEIETGGHVFHIDFTNATSILENQFIPSTTTTWSRGQFRWGFNFSRTFTLGGEKKQSWKK